MDNELKEYDWYTKDTDTEEEKDTDTEEEEKYTDTEEDTEEPALLFLKKTFDIIDGILEYVEPIFNYFYM